MQIQFTLNEIEVMLTSLEFSSQKISDAQGTPPEVRKENLARIQALKEKLQAAKKVG